MQLLERVLEVHLTRVDDVWGTVVRYTMSAQLHAASLHGKELPFKTRIFIWVNLHAYRYSLSMIAFRAPAENTVRHSLLSTAS